MYGFFALSILSVSAQSRQNNQTLSTPPAQQDVEELPVAPAGNDSKLVYATDEYVEALSSKGQFSGVLLIAKNGSTIFKKSWGLGDRYFPLNVETQFNIGSIGKSFTALAIHQLVAKKKIKFTDPIKKFLPNYPNTEAAKKVTIQHLLDMTSGIGDFFGEQFRAADKSHIRTLKDYFPFFAGRPLEFEPGTKTQYSNGAYIVLGAIIEKVTGKDYYTYIKNRIHLVE